MYVYLVRQGQKIELFKTLSFLCEIKNICRKVLYDKGIKQVNNEINYKGYLITKKQIVK